MYLIEVAKHLDLVRMIRHVTTNDEERRLLIGLKNSSVAVNLKIAQYVNSPRVERNLGAPVYQLLKRDTIPPFSL